MSIPVLRLFLFTGLIASTSTTMAQAMPASITGTWRIVKVLPTTNLQCWDAERAKTLLDTTLTYRPKLMAWRGGDVTIAEALSRTLTRRQFKDEYKVDLAELGIAAPSVLELDLQHEDADITGSTTEVPGDTVLLAGPGKIVVSACGIFYSAVRVTTKAAGGR